MSTYTDKIQPNQQKAINALVAGGNWKQAAAAADVTERTIYRWRNDNDFKQALSEAIQVVFDDNTRRVADGMSKALNHLISRLDDPKAEETHKDKIAIVLLRTGQTEHRTMELEAIQQEIELLKSRLGNE